MSFHSSPLKLNPQYRNYVWGGNRLKADSLPVAEAWVVYADNIILGGELDGQSLAQATLAMGEDLLGAGRKGGFPLLIKLIDAAQWLSLQVHPDDEQARRLEGAGLCGKIEAWHILDAPEGAELIAGFKPGVTPRQVRQAAGKADILELVARQRVQAGDSIFMPPGTIHAIGPGLLLYEIQQSSDITYRIYDWDRPQVAGRVLHVEKSAAVLKAENQGLIRPLAAEGGDFHQVLARSPYFVLEILGAEQNAAELTTNQQTFHALTVTQGAFELVLGGESIRLEKYESVLVPAACGAYTLLPTGSARALLAYVPGGQPDSD